MSESKPKQSIEFIQKSGDELLREEFGIQRPVDSPEFREQLRFTREELNNLRESVKKIREDDEQGKIEVLRRFIETKKSEKKFEARTEATQELAGAKIDALRGRVGPTQQKETKAEPKLLESPWEWAKEHPIMAGGLALGTAFFGYKALSWAGAKIGGMFKSGDSSADKKDDPKEGVINSLLEKIGIKGEYAKWAKNFGILGLVAAAGIGIFMGKDKIGEYIGKIGKFFGWESKEEKEVIEKTAQKYQISEGLLKKIKNEKIETFLGPTYNDFFSKAKNVVGNAIGLKSLLSMLPGIPDLSSEEIQELSKLRDHLKDLQNDHRISFTEKSTLLDFCVIDNGGDIDTDHKITLKKSDQKESQNMTDAKQNSNLQDTVVESGVMASVVSFLMGGSVTGEDRGLGARVLEYTAKAHYMKMLYNHYVSTKALSMEVGATRLDALKILNNGKWKQLQEMEEKGGFGKLIESLNSAKINGNKEAIKAAKKELDAYLKKAGEYDREFEKIVRNAKFPKKSAAGNEIAEQVDNYKKLRVDEAACSKGIQEIGESYEKGAKDLLETAKRESWTAERLSREQQTLSNEFGKYVSEFQKNQRNIQEQLKGTVKELSESQMGSEAIRHESGITTKVMPNGTMKIVLIGATIASIGFSSGWDKKKMGWMVGEAAGAFIPGVNMVLDARQIWTGTDLAGNGLGKWERWGLAPGFLVLDTIGSIASLTGIGYGGQAAIATLKGVKDVAIGEKVIKGAEAAKDAVEIAHEGEAIAHEGEAIAHEGEAIGKIGKLSEGTVKMMEVAKDAGVRVVDTAGTIRKVPKDFIYGYREGIAAAHSSGWFKAAKPLASVAKFAVYGSIGYSVCTGMTSLGEYVVGKKDAEPKLAKAS